MPKMQAFVTVEVMTPGLENFPEHFFEGQAPIRQDSVEHKSCIKSCRNYCIDAFDFQSSRLQPHGHHQPLLVSISLLRTDTSPAVGSFSEAHNIEVSGAIICLEYGESP